MKMGQFPPARPQIRATQSTLFWVITLSVFASDLLTKAWARQALTRGQPWPSQSAPVRLLLVNNPDLYLGLTLPVGGRVFYALLGASVIVSLLWAVAHLSSRAFPYVIAFGLVIGGGMSNIFEVGLNGGATDFVDLHMGAFNFADVTVVLGVMLYLWVRARDGAREEKWTWRTIWIVPHIFPPSARAT
jgi:lipoprotein signal peptidase